MAGPENKPFPIVIRELEVAEAFDVTPLMRRVVLTGEQLGAFRNNGHAIEPFRTENADDHVKLVLLGEDAPDAPDVPVPSQNDGHLDWHPEALGRARDYTPRRYDPEARRLELDFVRHSGGLAAGWAERARPGDRVHVAGPRGTTVLPPDIDWYYLVGDETALPAIARRIEELPPGTPVTAVVSVPSASEEQTFEHSANLHLTWVHRDTAGPNALMAAVESAPWREGQVYAWAAGEAGMLRPLRRWLKQEKTVPAGHTDIAGYWRAGQSQREMGEALHRLRHISDLSVPYAVRAAVSLDLAELVTDGHTTVPALAEAAGADPRGIRRLLRLLAHEELFALGADDSVRLLPAGSVLLEDHAHDHLDERAGHGRLHGVWPGLLHAVRTGEAGFPHARGHTFWEELATEERLGRTFDAVLDRWAQQWTPAVVRRLALTDERVVDVGGGTGALLGRLLEAYPQARGTLVELPSTARVARAELTERGVGDRLSIAEQSFFEPLPADGDVYVLAQVLHDWPDAEATAILRRAAEAAGDGRVVLVERLVTGELDDHEAAFDLLMYAVFGSGERTEQEFAGLANAAGLRPDRVVRLLGGLHLMELSR